MADLKKIRWRVLFASCLINLCLGSMYAWSVFAGPIADILHLENVSVVFTVATAIGFLPQVISGRINDKIGPKWLIFTGGLIFGLGMFACGYARTIWGLILPYGVGVGMSMGLTYGCTIANSIKFFPDKRGLAGGLTTAAYGLSSVIVPPVADFVNGIYGVRMSFKLFGVVFMAVICLCAFFIKTCPRDFCLQEVDSRHRQSRGSAVNKTWRTMITEPIFYIMMMLLTCGAVFGLMIVSGAASVGQNMIGLSSAAAATFTSVLALFNTLGRVFSGMISDKIGRINTLFGALILAVAGMLLLFICRNGTIAAFFIGMALVGLCFGTFMGVYPGFTSDEFGAENNTVNYGIMWIGFCIAGVVGPMVLSSVYANTGTYKTAFLIAVLLAGAGIMFTFVYRKMKSKKNSGGNKV